MQKEVINPIRFKGGYTMPKGVKVNLHVPKRAPWLMNVTWGTTTKKIKSINACKYFDGFVPVNIDALQSQVYSSISESLTGIRIEPDGWDEHEMPSMLLAAGLI